MVKIGKGENPIPLEQGVVAALKTALSPPCPAADWAEGPYVDPHKPWLMMTAEILQRRGHCCPGQILLWWCFNWVKILLLADFLSKTKWSWGISSCSWRNVIFLEAFWQQTFFSLYNLANAPCSFLKQECRTQSLWLKIWVPGAGSNVIEWFQVWGSENSQSGASPRNLFFFFSIYFFRCLWKQTRLCNFS